MTEAIGQNNEGGISFTRLREFYDEECAEADATRATLIDEAASAATIEDKLRVSHGLNKVDGRMEMLNALAGFIVFCSAEAAEPLTPESFLPAPDFNQE